MGKGILRVVLCGFIVLGFVGLRASKAQVQFYELGPDSLVGDLTSRVFGVSPDGSLIVGGSGKATYGATSVAAYWDVADMVDALPPASGYPPARLGFLPGDSLSEATAVLDSGIVVGWSRGLSLGTDRTQGFYIDVREDPPGAPLFDPEIPYLDIRPTGAGRYYIDPEHGPMIAEMDIVTPLAVGVIDDVLVMCGNEVDGPVHRGVVWERPTGLWRKGPRYCQELWMTDSLSRGYFLDAVDESHAANHFG